MAQLTTQVAYQLTVRQHESGPGLLKAVEPIRGYPDPAQRAHDHLTIWVHGYNNDQGRAAEIWAITAAGLGRIEQVSLEDVAVFYWPGDQWSSRVASAAAYPAQIPIARQAASLLAAYLASLRPAGRILRLRFIAHSLGCLLVLETVRNLRTMWQAGNADVHIEPLVLMAAAVPQGLCVPGQGLYGETWRPRTKDQAFYSGNDRVLEAAFPLGQKAATILGWAQAPKRTAKEYLRAVGREGAPKDRWHSVSMFGFDHGDYWTKSSAWEEIARVMPRKVRKPRQARVRPHPVLARRPRARCAHRRSVPSRRARLTDWRATGRPVWPHR